MAEFKKFFPNPNSANNGTVNLTVTSASYAEKANYVTSASYAGTASLLLGSVVSASYALTASYAMNGGGGGGTTTGSFTGSFTGSLNGTASYALKVLSSSYASTASYVLQAISASYASTSSYAVTASYALNGGVTQLLAGPNITLSPSNGLGQVTITSTAGGGGTGNTATGSYGSFYSTQTQTASVANTPTSMSFNIIDISNGVTISGSTSSSIKITNSGIYNIQFSAQLARNAGSGTEDVLIWLRKNGSDLAWTNTDVTFAGSTNISQVAAWNWFITAVSNDYYELMWSTTSTNIVILANTTPNPDVPSIILTVNRIDQFLSNTGSFTGSFIGTLTGTASYATTSSYVTTAQTASYVTLAQTASYVLNAVSASYASTASYVLNAVSASYAPNAAFPYTGSATITGSLNITGSTSILNGNLTVDGTFPIGNLVVNTNFRGLLLPTYAYLGNGFASGHPTSTDSYMNWNNGSVTLNVASTGKDISLVRNGTQRIVLNSSDAKIYINANEVGGAVSIRPQDTSVVTSLYVDTLNSWASIGFPYNSESLASGSLHVRNKSGKNSAIVAEGASTGSTQYSFRAYNSASVNLFSIRDDGYTTLSGSLTVTGSLTTNDGVYVQTVTASFISASGGITGSLYGLQIVSGKTFTVSSSLTISGSDSTTQIFSPWSDNIQNGTVLKLVSGNQTTTSNVASNITELVTGTLAANTRWRVFGHMTIGCDNTGGVKLQVTLPTGAGVLLWYLARSSTATAFTNQFNNASTTLTTSAICTANQQSFVLVEGEVTIGATPGTIQWGFASGTSTQTSTIYQLGTQITLQRIV